MYALFAKRSMIGLAVVTSLLILMMGCSGGGDALKVGQILPVTGSLSFFGEDHGDAAKLAAEQVLAAGGPEVSIIVGDTQVNPEVGVEAARKLVDTDKVVAIVGALSSGVSMAVSKAVTTPNGVLQISAASS
jgi:branched-chain amino acid transport system substrate-binding protein